MKRIPFSLSVCVCLFSNIGCGGGNTRMEPAPAGAYGTLVQNGPDGTVSRDLIRDELREVLLPCQRDIDNLRDRRLGGQRTQRLLAVIAKLVETFAISDFRASDSPARDLALEALIADRESGGPECTGGTLSRTCAMASEQQFGFRFSGPRNDVVGPQALPERAIESALEAIDAVLWAHRDSEDWSEEERTRYASTFSDLARLCEQLHHAKAE